MEVGIGATFLIHIALVTFILAAIAITPCMELMGRRTGNQMYLRYAYKLNHSVLYLYSFAATWAVFAIVLLTGFYGRLVGTMLNELLIPLTIAFMSFFIGIPLLLAYSYGWEKLPPKLHLAVGFAFIVVQYVFLIFIVDLDSFILDPGIAVSAAHANFSPTYFPLLFHYAFGNLSWAALFLAAVAVWRGRRAPTAADAEFQHWAARLNFAIGSVFLMAQPISGFFLAETLKNTQMPAFDNLFVLGSGNLFIAQVVLLAVVVIGANWVFWRHDEKRDGGPGGVLTVIAVLGMAGTALPASIIPAGLVALRYAALAVAFLATLAHLVIYIRDLRRMDTRVRVAPAARGVIGVVGVTALALALFMGIIKENSKIPCAIGAPQGQSACLLTLHSARQNFNAPRGYLP